jgi:methylated-DNA-[protein]-cysteine S-methyltransferase
MVRFTLFETPIGTGGMAWSDRGVCGVQLPEPDAVRIRARLRRRFPAADEVPPPPEIWAAIQQIAALLEGKGGPCDLSALELDLSDVPPFDQQVYAVARQISPGATMTYGEIATRLGDVHLAREVGQAMAHNPFPIVVPCHRVVAAGGKLGGFSARGGVTTKQRLLAIEQANVSWQLPLQV